MEKMSNKFSHMIYYLTFLGHITILEDKTKPNILDRKPIITWDLLQKDKIKYYENKEKDIQAIKINKYVFLINIVYIRDSPFIVASKRDMRSIKGKNFKEVK